MSVAKSKEEKLRVKEFQKMLEEELALIDSFMQPTTDTLLGMKRSLGLMGPEEVRKTLMDRIKTAGLLVWKFNSMAESYKVGLFEKLMKWVEKLKNILEEYGKKIGVEFFSIEVGLPLGVSISFTFKPKG